MLAHRLASSRGHPSCEGLGADLFFGRIDMRRAQATVASDREAIFRSVADGVGFDRLNQSVIQAVLGALRASELRACVAA